MTTHHISAKQMIVEPFEERRAEQYSYMGNGTLRCDGLKPMHERRYPWHDYSTKKELVTVYVPVEPEPEWLPGEEKFWNIKINCPFSPQDKINDTHEVVKVIGVEERDVAETVMGEEQTFPAVNITIDKKWHFQLLCEEQNETINR